MNSFHSTQLTFEDETLLRLNECIYNSDDEGQLLSDDETQTTSFSEKYKDHGKDRKSCLHVDLQNHDHWAKCITHKLCELAVVNIEAGIEELSIEGFVDWINRSAVSWDQVQLCSSDNYSSQSMMTIQAISVIILWKCYQSSRSSNVEKCFFQGLH